MLAGYRVHKDGEGVGSMLLGLYDDDGPAAPRRASPRRSRPRNAPRCSRSSSRSATARSRTTRGPSGPSSRPPPKRPTRRLRRRDGPAPTGRGEPLERDEGPLLGAGSRRARRRGAFRQLESGRFRGVTSFMRWRPDRDPGELPLRPARGGVEGAVRRPDGHLTSSCRAGAVSPRWSPAARAGRRRRRGGGRRAVDRRRQVRVADGGTSPFSSRDLEEHHRRRDLALGGGSAHLDLPDARHVERDATAVARLGDARRRQRDRLLERDAAGRPLGRAGIAARSSTGPSRARARSTRSSFIPTRPGLTDTDISNGGASSVELVARREVAGVVGRPCRGRARAATR